MYSNENLQITVNFGISSPNQLSARSPCANRSCIIFMSIRGTVSLVARIVNRYICLLLADFIMSDRFVLP